MIYIIKCIRGKHSKDDFSIVEGQEREVNKDTYNYYNKHFGSSGNFTFATKEVPKRVKKETKVEDKEVKVAEDKPKVEPKTPKTTTKKDS